MGVETVEPGSSESVKPGRDVACELLPEDLIRDLPLQADGDDEFGHVEVASRLAELVLHVPAKTNVALFGPWGSGKSSIEPLLRECLKDSEQSDQVKLVRYDAWRFAGTSLKRNFLVNAADALDADASEDSGEAKSRAVLKRKKDLADRLYRQQTEVRFELQTVLKRVGWAAAIFAVAVCVMSLTYAGFAQIPGEPRARSFGTDMLEALAAAWRFGAGPAAAVVGAIPVFEFARVTISRSALADDEEFVQVLQELVADSKFERVVFFVDELDRCSPDDVLQTLVAVRTFLELEKAVFIVAADRDVLVSALEHQQIDGHAQVDPNRAFEPYYSTAGSFLDKLFQHQIEIPPLRRHSLGRLARRLASAKGSGIWKELADAGKLDGVIYVLVPTHLQSPRRVKVLMNNFAVNARLAASRGVEDWVGQSEQIAKLGLPPVLLTLGG